MRQLYKIPLHVELYCLFLMPSHQISILGKKGETEEVLFSSYDGRKKDSALTSHILSNAEQPPPLFHTYNNYNISQPTIRVCSCLVSTLLLLLYSNMFRPVYYYL